MISITPPTSLTRLLYCSRRLVLFTASLLLLSACGSPHNTKPVQNNAEQRSATAWQSHFDRVVAIDHWYARAKIAVIAKGEGFGGHLSWQQRGDSYEIDFVGPLGIGLMQVSGNAEQSTLTLPDRPTYNGDSPEQLLHAHTGYQLPISQLYFWARGIANPELPHQLELNRAGQLKGLQQLGWDIEYLNYRKQQGLMLPTKIVMIKDGIKFKLVRLDWQAMSAGSS
mgnify:CR=1 FL=1